MRKCNHRFDGCQLYSTGIDWADNPQHMLHGCPSCKDKLHEWHKDHKHGANNPYFPTDVREWHKREQAHYGRLIETTM